MKVINYYYIATIIIIDFIILFTTNKLCENMVIGDYVKAFSFQILVILFVLNANFLKNFFRNLKLNIGFIYLLTIILSISSFYILWNGVQGGYVFGGQRYCTIDKIPKNYLKYL